MIYLASQSPRRQALLAQLQIDFELIEVDVHESRLPGEAPRGYVSRVAREKAGAGLLQLAGSHGALVLGADTDVVLDDAVLGKPQDAAQASAMLRMLSGRTHEVVTAVWLLSAGREAHCVVGSRVRFAELGDDEIEAYVASGEPFGKAGAYAVQGLGAAFVASVEGSYSGIVGLPLHETYRLLRQFGLPPARQG